MLAVFVENRSRRVWRVLVEVKSRARSSPNEDIERDFRALLASVAEARALGSTFRRSRDVRCKPRSERSSLAALSLSPQWLAKVVTTVF